MKFNTTEINRKKTEVNRKKNVTTKRGKCRSLAKKNVCKIHIIFLQSRQVAPDLINNRGNSKKIVLKQK